MNANQTLQEYADNSGNRLTVDRARGAIPGVKLLGRVSKKGREYPPAVMAKALPLYEGMRVNVDHVDPGQRRSLRDRIGLVKNVTLKEDGLYGDFHFNPKHPLAEQIAWDAENAPQNLGFSHDTRGGSRNQNGQVVVESIDTVLSVDLVANPAATTGLFESTDRDWKDIDIPGLSTGGHYPPRSLPSCQAAFRGLGWIRLGTFKPHGFQDTRSKRTYLGNAELSSPIASSITSLAAHTTARRPSNQCHDWFGADGRVMYAY